MIDGHNPWIMLKVVSPTIGIGYPASLGEAQFEHRESASLQKASQRPRGGKDGAVSLHGLQERDKLAQERQRMPPTCSG